jgi:hypothetical protein
MANARNRERRQGRQRPFRDPKPTILVVTEGVVTEPEYLHGLRKHCRNSRVTIQVAKEHGVPRTLVEIAKHYKEEAITQASQEKDDNIAYDSVWCVFDIDEHPQVGEAKEMARDNDINLGISNPCFELWLLLHFRENPGMKNPGQMKDLLKRNVPNYDKHVDFATYAEGYAHAVERASKMDQAAEEVSEAHRNPTTGVYKLTELISNK